MTARVKQTIALLISILPVTGQDFFKVAEGAGTPANLVPVTVDFPEYRKRISDHLLVTPSDLGLMISRPSFEGESAVAVYEKRPNESKDPFREVTNEKKEFFITYTQAGQSLWYSMAENHEEGNDKEVTIKRYELQISRRLASAIQRCWGRMLLRTRYPAEAYEGRDGVTYEFGVFVRGLGPLRGEIWSPRGGLSARLAELGSQLQEVAKKGEKVTPAIEDKLCRNLRELEVAAGKGQSMTPNQIKELSEALKALEEPSNSEESAGQ